MLLRNTNARILYGDLNLPIESFGRDDDLAARGRVLQGIGCEIDQNLYSAVFIGEDAISPGQLSARQAMEQAQAGSIAELKRAGVAL